MTESKCIRKLGQGMFTSAGPLFKRGICYFMCEYLADHKDSIWKNPANFAAAREASTTMPLAAMMNYAKSKEHRLADQEAGYSDPLPVRDNSLYHIELKVDDRLDHEVLAIIGSGELMLFDPNAGIYHISHVASDQYHVAIYDALDSIHSSVGKVSCVNYKRARKAFS